MTEAMDWSMWRWLLEKGRVREIADRATAALDAADRKAKAAWSDQLKIAYNELVDQDTQPKPSPHRQKHKENKKKENASSRETMRLARRLKEADDEAERVRLDAEDTFDQAERQMNTDLARQGAGKALKTYDLRENAIRQSEAASCSRESP